MIEIDTNFKDLKSIKECFKNNGVFYSSLDLAEKLKSFITFPVDEVYDPTCGAGALLSVFGDDVKKYGQELDENQACYAQKTLRNAEIISGDTLVSPAFYNHKFKAIVANPPFSVKWNPNLLDERFMCAPALAPSSKADYAFILHCLHYLANDGLAVIVCYPGIMYRNGAEQKIREYLVKNNFVDCIIQLPNNLFFGTSIVTCIMVLKKNKIDNKVLFIDSSNDCIKVTNNNKLAENNISHIVDLFTKREDIAYVSHLATFDEIKSNKFNLSVSTYVEAEDTREIIDINKLNAELDEIVKRENELRIAINSSIDEIEV